MSLPAGQGRVEEADIKIFGIVLRVLRREILCNSS